MVLTVEDTVRNSIAARKGLSRRTADPLSDNEGNLVGDHLDEPICRLSRDRSLLRSHSDGV